MADYRKPFRCEVLTPEARLCSLDTVSVVFPGTDGQVGVLGGRAPMVARLGAGPLTIHTLDETREMYYIAGGFAQMREDRLTILAEECVPIEQIDREAAWEEIRTAQRLPADTPEARSDRAEAVHAARIKFRLSQEAPERPARKRRAGADERA